jgi:hypothetical protein
MTGLQIGEKKMRRKGFLATASLFVLFGFSASAAAQVKQVQMHIAGYLCGN